MKTIRILSIVALAASMALTGCVSKKKYTALQTRYDALQTDYNAAQIALAESRAGHKSVESLLEEARKNNSELKEAYGVLQRNLEQSMNQNSQGNVNIAKLVDEINASNRYIKQLVDAKSKSDSLNLILTNNLTRSLSRDDLRDVVEGNTDNVPISRTNIRNNWDLSALRASSVVQVLQNRFGVNPSRLTAAGRGEYNPVADNDSDYGRQQNRRTEIIITPQLDQFLDLIDHAPDTDEAK